MLITPITPNVMASPIAASNRTEPSERPYQAFAPCSRPQAASERTKSLPWQLARQQEDSFAGRSEIRPSESRSPRARMTEIAASLSASVELLPLRMIAARASSSARLVRLSVSPAMALSKVGECAGLARFEHLFVRRHSACRDRATTASGRQGPRRCRHGGDYWCPTVSMSAGGSPRTTCPVAASKSLLFSSWMYTAFFSALNINWPFSRAFRIASARGLTLEATCEMPVSVSSKSPAVKCASASSRASACAVLVPRRGRERILRRRGKLGRSAWRYPRLLRGKAEYAFPQFQLPDWPRSYEPPQVLVTVL